MTSPTAAPPDWEAIRHRYETTDAAVADICHDAGIAPNQLHYRRQRGRWTRQKPRAFPPPKRAASAQAARRASPAPKRRSAGTRSRSLAVRARRAARTSASREHRRQLLDQATVLIALKITQLEIHMTQSIEQSATGEPVAAVDHERETRAITSLIENLDKIAAIETAHDSAAGTTADADLARETERRRQELTERLKKLVEASAQHPQ